jgi:type II secretory pathway component GspD/PulD (secretin)
MRFVNSYYFKILRTLILIFCYFYFSCINGQVESLPNGVVNVNVFDTPCGNVISEVADMFGIEASYEGANNSQTFKGQVTDFSSFLTQYMTDKDILIEQKANKWRIIENDSTRGKDEILNYYYTAKNVPPIELVKKIEDLRLEASTIALKHQSSILINGTYNQVKNALKLIETIDNVINSITVEFLVVEYTHINGYNWGVNLQTGQHGNFSSGLYNPGSIEHGISFIYDVTNLLESSFLLNLQALVENNFAKIATNPHITVNNGDTAQINISENKFIQLQTASINGISTQLQEINTGIKLGVTPNMTSDSIIHLNFSGEVSEFMPNNNDGTYTVESNTVQTNVDLQNGETLIVGGLIREEKVKQTAGVPFLSRIPIIGLLFKRQSKNKTFVETVIYITARHVKPILNRETQHLFYKSDNKKIIKEESDGLKLEEEFGQ